MRGVIVLAVLLVGTGAAAHPLAPALLELTERPSGDQFDVVWKTSVLRVPGSDLRPRLPEHCAETTPVAVEQSGDRRDQLVRRWSVDCGERGLVGSRIGFDGLGPARIDALVRVALADGRVVRGVVRADEPLLEVSQAPTRDAVFVDYLQLGLDHILGGIDHLLFVFGLLLLVRGDTRLLAKIITAFTVGHSVTLSLAALGLVRYPTQLIELIIALSIFFVAVELSRSGGPESSVMRRRPWAIAVCFGLLHGLGFAGALAEIGLPAGEIPLALLAFNAGIELGQLAFVFAILLAQRLLQPLLDAAPRWVEQIPLYAMGSLAAFWCFERLAAVLAA